MDLFVPSRPLKVFTPTENPGSKAISQQFQWPGHYLKFECDGGEIDFLSAHLQTTPGFTWERYRNRDIALETLAEVIVKKIRFRSATFTSRDIFDLAAVGKCDPAIVGILASEVYDALPRLRTVIHERSKLRGRLGMEIRPTKKFEGLIDTAFSDAIEVVDAAIEWGGLLKLPRKTSLHSAPTWGKSLRQLRMPVEIGYRGHRGHTRWRWLACPQKCWTKA